MRISNNYVLNVATIIMTPLPIAWHFFQTKLQMSTIILVVLLLISQSCITHGDDYGDSYGPNPTLYEAFKKALISNETNLIRLQSHFYPSNRNSGTSATIVVNSSCDFTVKNISY